METKIEKIGINGEGIGFINKKPIFIHGVLPGEYANISITQKHDTYSIGELNRVIQSSKDRVLPECKIHKKCGACTMMHANYKTQLNFKYDILRETLWKYARIKESLIQPVVANEQPLFYRNSLKLPFAMKNDKLTIGMYEQNSNRFVEVKQCIVHEQRLDEIKIEIVKILNQYHYKAYTNNDKKGLRYLVLRMIDDKCQCTFVHGGMSFDDTCIDKIMNIPEVISVCESINASKKQIQIFGDQLNVLEGKKQINFRFDDLKVTLSARSFFQLNTKQAENLYHIVDTLIPDHQNLLVEAYCGVGIMSLFMAKKADKVIGIESIKDAIKNARRNAERNNIKNAEFIVGDAGKQLVKLSKVQQIDTLIVDPPRSGLDETMLDCIMKSNIKQIVYVSCNPATLAKNLNVLSKIYNVETVIPVDMFSQTAHIESVVSLSKKD